MRRALTIIGGGNVGKTLGHLWTSNDIFLVQDVLNRTLESAERAVTFIGAGNAVDDFTRIRPADIYMIATPDDHIASCCDALARTGNLSKETIVFHCSGALRSAELQPAIEQGASVASIHPIRSFAAPDQVIQNFSGTYCGVEGDRHALEILGAAFSAIGAEIVSINADSKTLYHSAAVFACNYLTTLLDVAQRAYIQSGIPEEAALKLMEPLVRETIDNIFRLGPAQALSGPVARGDMQTVEQQHRAIAAWNTQYADLYDQLAKLTAVLAARRKQADD